MSFLLNRWYDPSVGRWTSEDPIGFAGGDANLGRYVANSASRSTDPSGLVIKVGGDEDYRKKTIKRLRKVVNADQKLKTFIRKLHDSDHEIVIRPQNDPDVDRNYTVAQDPDDATNGNGTGSTIYYDPDTKQADRFKRTPEHVLCHELSHAYDNFRGVKGDRSDNEAQAIFMEGIYQDAVERDLRKP